MTTSRKMFYPNMNTGLRVHLEDEDKPRAEILSGALVIIIIFVMIVTFMLELGNDQKFNEGGSWPGRVTSLQTYQSVEGPGSFLKDYQINRASRNEESLWK